MTNTLAPSALALPTLANPYPYYLAYLQGDSLIFDEKLQCWIASHADVVQAIFESTQFVVRPVHEKVPKLIAGSCAGNIFSDLVRMNEGLAHTMPKQVLQTSLRDIDLTSLSLKMDQVCSHLLVANEFSNTQLITKISGTALSEWVLRFPVYCVASLIGFSEETWPQIADWVNDFIQSLSPLCTPLQLDAASAAARNLQESMIVLLQNSQAEQGSFLAQLQSEAKQVGWQHADAIVANLIGLLSQTYEASAGLIGNSLIQLRHELKQNPTYLQNSALPIDNSPSFWRNFVEEVARLDPPVQNTRRFVTEDCLLAGKQLRAGDSILILIAAANRDPKANLDPNTFQIDRINRKLFTFSHGRHACPGHSLALHISAYAIKQLGQSLSPISSIHPIHHLTWEYRPSLNGRIPIFTNTKEIS